jgi:cytochrome c-type biogenesis protein CcmF
VFILVIFGFLFCLKKSDSVKVLYYFNGPLVCALFMGGLIPLFYGSYEVIAAITIFVASWVVSVTVRDVWQKSAHSRSRLYGFMRLNASYFGMIIAHIGVAVCIVGVGLTSVYSTQRDVRMEPGDQIEVTVTKNDLSVATLYPQKRRYLASGQTMTEAAINSGMFRDIYVALGERLKGDAWALRIYVKPFVIWIWLGTLFIAVGALVALTDKRYRRGYKKVINQ